MRKYTILIVLCLLLNLFDTFAGVRPLLRITSGQAQNDNAEGSFWDPWVINSKTVEFIMTVTGDDVDEYLYWPQIHMDGERNCTTLEVNNLCGRYQRTLSIGQIQNVTFSYTFEMCGRFYLRIDWKERGTDTWENYWEDWGHILIEVPPVNDELYSEPYSPPQGNSPPNFVCTPLNIMRGSGSYGDPWILHEDSTFKFTFSNCSDPDGLSDLDGGCFNWGVHTYDNSVTGTSHFYGTTPGAILTEPETFYYYSALDSTFTGDVALYTPKNRDSCCVLMGELYDKYGQLDMSVKEYCIRLRTVKDEPYVPSNPIGTITPDTLDMGGVSTDSVYVVKNEGTGTLSWSSSIDEATAWYRQNVYSGNVPEDSKQIVTVYVNRDSMAIGTDSAKVTIADDSLWIYITKAGGETNDPILAASPDSANFGKTDTSETIYISNVGTGVLSWSCAIPDCLAWFTVSSDTGDVQANDVDTVTAYCTRSQASDGDNEGWVKFTGGGNTDSLITTMTKWDPPVAPTNLKAIAQ